MNPLRHQFIKDLLLIAGCCWYLSSHLDAAPSKLESDSPFLPPGYSTAKPPPRLTQKPNSPLARELEFRGVVLLDGIYHFSLFKKSENKGYWISENDSQDGMEISDFDVNSMEITVTVNGRSEQLTIIAASEYPLPVVAKPQQLPMPVVRPATMPVDIKQLQSAASKNPPRRRTIPRRRVIVPNNK